MTIGQTETYILYPLPGFIPFGLIMISESIIRALARNDLALKSMLLDYLFIILILLGVIGAALATSLYQMTAFYHNRRILFSPRRIPGSLCLKSEASEVFLTGTALYQKLLLLFTLLHIGILQGMQPLLGYSKGAGKSDLVEKPLRFSYGSFRILCMTFFFSYPVAGSRNHSSVFTRKKKQLPPFR